MKLFKLFKRKKSRKKRGFFARLRRGLLRVFMFGLIGVIMLVLAVRFINPPINAYQFSEYQRIGKLKRSWTPIERISAHMPRAAVAAEDANFCDHNGFDFEAIQAAIEGGGARGASTISQQVAKNVFLWQGRSWIRKGLEVGFTSLIELLWPKQRIIEVYLNIAEFDEGVFGVNAAAKHYFGVEVARLSALQSARLAAVLPSPKKRSASRPTKYIRKRTGAIMSGAETILADGRADCFTIGAK